MPLHFKIYLLDFKGLKSIDEITTKSASFHESFTEITSLAVTESDTQKFTAKMESLNAELALTVEQPPKDDDDTLDPLQHLFSCLDCAECSVLLLHLRLVRHVTPTLRPKSKFR